MVKAEDAAAFHDEADKHHNAANFFFRKAAAQTGKGNKANSDIVAGVNARKEAKEWRGIAFDAEAGL